MVKLTTFFSLLFVISSLLFANIELSVDVDSDFASENRPFLGKIMIKHPNNAKVDERCFQLDDEPLETSLVSQNKQTSITIINGRREEVHETISFFTFKINPKEVGVHTLGAIKAKIGDRVYQTKPISYEIFTGQAHSGFRLKGEIIAPKKLYPGQKITVLYSLSLSGPVEVTHKNLPLLSPSGFKKIGIQKNQSYTRGKYLIHEFSQELYASESGSFDFKDSVVEGFAYQEDFFGRRRYQKPKLVAKAPPMKLEVLEFPKEGKPLSFQGAVGDFSMDVNMLTANNIYLGDKIELGVKLEGDGIETLQALNIAEQKNFKKAFRFNDLPPVIKKTDRASEFIVELRPMDKNIIEIPPIEFSYFNPKEEKYFTLKSNPIPVEVLTAALPPKEDVFEEAIKSDPINEVEIFEEPTGHNPQLVDVFPLIDIKGVFPLSSKEMMKDSKKGLMLIISSLAVLALLIQYGIKKIIQTKSKRKKRDSGYYFSQALKSENDIQLFYFMLERAFQTKFLEKGYTQQILPIEKAPKERKTEGIKEFMLKLQSQLYSKEEKLDIKQYLDEAKDLYKSL